MKNDNQNYKFGIFYFNPKDKTLFPKKRFGIGWTINFGQPLAWVLLIVLIIIAFVIASAIKSAN
ncbi:MAG: DUF5808 domain-containing protein [Endomicrobium sp.]|jgi:uncharacterized membrane protein|nr:DUF5808 domain-containing protein [Endomicrobium sp.]